MEEIQQAHLLLAMFNAWQPGVFALSGWDLCGMLPLPREQVRGLLRGGDTRWIHRAAYDLMGYGENDRFTGMPQGTSLYGTAARAARDAGVLRPRAARPCSRCATPPAWPPRPRSTCPRCPTAGCS